MDFTPNKGRLLVTENKISKASSDNTPMKGRLLATLLQIWKTVVQLFTKIKISY